MHLRRCTDCDIEKPLDQFSRASGTHKCNPCRSAAEKARVAKKLAEDPEGFRAKRREIGNRCRANRLATDPEYRRLENEKGQRIRAGAKERDPERFREMQRGYRATQTARLHALNPHHFRDVANAWRRKNPDRARELARESYRRLSADPAFRVKVIDKSTRRQRTIAKYPPMEPAAWFALCEEHDHRCAYCLRREPLTIEHVIPLCRGGAHDMTNIVPACASCNKSKGANGPIDLLLKPRLLVTRRMLAAAASH